VTSGSQGRQNPQVATSLPEEPGPKDDRPVYINSELSVRRIAKGAFVVTHEPAFDSNILVVRMADGTVVLCSSPFDTQATRIMLGWIRDVFGPGRILAVNTHFHPDGTAGNEAYAEAGVETYATDLTQRLLADHGARIRDGAAAALENPTLAARVRGTRIVPAAHTIKATGGVTFTIGGEAVHVIYPGPAHSPDNVVVHFPTRGILFGGCMIKTGDAIGNTADADLGHWEAAVRSVERLGSRIVVPGHGPAGGPELFQNTVAVVKAVHP
jgi:glyoxylase-like metal-dependent hydrolase (beta-lactamase superfamily II)